MLKRVILFIVFFTVFCSTAYAALFENEREYIEVKENGEVNWSTLTIRAKGSSKDYIESIEKKAADFTPLEAAEADGRFGLIETLKEVPLSTSYHIDDVVFLYEDIKNKMYEAVKKAKIVGDPVEKEDGTLEVVMELSLTGDILDMMLPKIESLPKSDGKPFQGRARYTSIVFDASKTDLEPVLLPSITDDREQVYYMLDEKNRANAVDNGFVKYFRSLEDAKASFSTGRMPFVIDYIRMSKYKEDTLESPVNILDKVRNNAFRTVILRRCKVIIIIK